MYNLIDPMQGSETLATFTFSQEANQTLEAIGIHIASLFPSVAETPNFNPEWILQELKQCETLLTEHIAEQASILPEPVQGPTVSHPRPPESSILKKPTWEITPDEAMRAAWRHDTTGPNGEALTEYSFTPPASFTQMTIPTATNTERVQLQAAQTELTSLQGFLQYAQEHPGLTLQES